MLRFSTTVFLRLCAVAAMLCLSIIARADPMPALNLEDRKNWTAIGLVNAAGYRGKASCTGTLIAPDLVLTAAHCAGKISGTSSGRHFVAGWDRGSFAAHRLSTETFIHPRYSSAQGDDQFQYDIAVLKLREPIHSRQVAPLAPNSHEALRLGEMAILGYHRKRPNVINGQFDCDSEPERNPVVLVLDCEVISGNSGGPVLVAVGDDWTVVAVVAARIGGTSPRALAVPVGDWVMSHWRAAMDRAAVADPKG